jgi:uncharacterized protein with HEPN domain
VPVNPLVLRLRDLLAAIDAVGDFVQGHDFDSYSADTKTRWSVERAIEIVSEASRHIPTEMTEPYPHIPWRDVRAVGNRLRHEYFRVDEAVTWNIATRSLPELRAVIAAMLVDVEQTKQ